MSVITADRICPRHSGMIKIGPVAPPEQDGDVVTKLYVDTSSGHVLPTYVAPLSYNIGPNTVTFDTPTYNAPMVFNASLNSVSVNAADATHNGVVSTTAQTISGAKTFTGTLEGPGLNYECSNGWISGGTITFVPNGTLFSVSSVTARFSDYTVEGHPVPGAVVTFPAVNNIPIQFPTSIDVGVYIDDTGAVSQDASAYNVSLLYNSRIRLGRLIQPAGTIIAVSNSKYPVADRWQNSCLDFFLRTSPLNLNGMHVSAGGADLSIAVGSGTVWEQNSNIQTNRANPSTKSIPPMSKPVMVSFWRNNLNTVILGDFTQQLDTTLYNPAGTSATLMPITTGYWVNIPILYNPAGNTVAFQYPTEQYSTNDGAVLALGNFVRLSEDLKTFVVIGYVTVQQGATDLSLAIFSTGNFFAYGVQEKSTQLSQYTPVINKQSSTVFVDQTIGDDATGSVGNRGRPFKTINAAVAQVTDAANENPYVVFLTPGKHPDATVVLPPHFVLWGYSQRSGLLEIGSGVVTVDPVTWLAETESALLTLTNVQLLETGFTANLRAIGVPPFTPAPDEWLSEIEISYSIIDGPVSYIARTVQDLFKLISADFEEDITIDGGNFIMFNSEHDLGKTLTISAVTVDCVSVFTGATLGDVVFNGVSSATNSASISGSHILGSLTVNGSNASVNINRGSLPTNPANIHLTNGGIITVYDDLLTTDEVAAVHANTTLAGANAVADVALVTNGLAGKVPTTRTVNGHALSANVTVSASDLTTGTLPVAQLPAPIPVSCLSTATLGNNTTGTAYALAVSSLLPDGTTAYTQTDGSNNTRVATCAYLDRLRGASGGLATLDALTGKVPDDQINLAGIGALVFKGSFDASAVHDYPTVPPTVNGNFWIISAGGLVSGAGYSTYTFGIGDWMIFNGVDWEQIPSDTLTIINAWTGSSNIHTVGTITAGTWQATHVGASYGGVDGLTGILKGVNTFATVAGTADYISPSVSNTYSATLTVSGTLLAQSVARTDSSANVATTSYVQSAANVPQSHVIFKSATGNDSRSGLTHNEAVLTFAQAMTLISASAPSSSNQYVVYCADASEDGPISLIPFVHLEATSMKLLGHNNIGDYSYIHVKRIDNPGVSGISLHFTGGTDPASVSVVRSYKLIGGGILVDSNQGDTHIMIEQITGISPPNEVIRVGSGSRLFVDSCILTGKIVADGANCLIDLSGVGDISGCTFERTAPADPTCRIIYPANGIGNITGIVKCDGAGNASVALSGTDYVAPTFNATLSGHVTGSGPLNASIATTIANGAVTLGKIGTIAASSVIGNPSTSATNPSTVGMTASIVGSRIVLRDTNGSAQLLHATEGFRTAAMDSGSYNLTMTDSAIQEWTGSDSTSTENVIMPDATTVTLGYRYQVINSSAGIITAKNAAGTTLNTLLAGESMTFICKDIGSSSGQWMTSRANVLQNLIGDVTATGRGTVSTTIAPNAVTFAKMQTLPGVSVIGNTAAGSATASALTIGTDIMSGGQAFTATGDVTGTGALTSSIALTVGANKITLAKMATIGGACVLGNISGSNGDPATVSAVTTATASSVVVRDATQNAFARHFVDQIDTTAITVAGTTLMTFTSGGSIEFTGTSPQYAYLPDATTLAVGITYRIHNTGTSPLYVSASGAATTLVTLYTGVVGTFECNSISTAAGVWRVSVANRRPPVFDRIYTNFMNSTASNITASATITTAQLWGGPQRTVNNVTLTTPAATTLYADLTTILGFAPPVGFQFQAYFLSSGNTQTWSAGAGCQFYPTGGITVANGTTGQFVIIVRSSTTYDFMSMR